MPGHSDSSAATKDASVAGEEPATAEADRVRDVNGVRLLQSHTFECRRCRRVGLMGTRYSSRCASRASRANCINVDALSGASQRPPLLPNRPCPRTFTTRPSKGGHSHQPEGRMVFAGEGDRWRLRRFKLFVQRVHEREVDKQVEDVRVQRHEGHRHQDGTPKWELVVPFCMRPTRHRSGLCSVWWRHANRRQPREISSRERHLRAWRSATSWRV